MLVAFAAWGLGSPSAQSQERAPTEGEEPGVRVRLQQRTRYETLDPQYRAGLSNSDQALALRTSVTFDWRRDGLRLFAEVMDSRSELNDTGSFANFTTTNTLDPIQSYVALSRRSSIWRIGRVTQDLGKRRLLARNSFRNTTTSFTGVDWLWSGDAGQAVRAFYWVPMRFLPSDLASVLDNDAELDRGTRDSALKGVFYQWPNFDGGHRLESYLFDYELDSANDPTLAADLVSLGSRGYRAPTAGQWNYEVEAVLQRGHSGGSVGGIARPDLGHRASLLHLELGFMFDKPWAFNLMLQYDRATGDEDPTDQQVERFNTLFGSRRFEYGPTGIYGTRRAAT